MHIDLTLIASQDYWNPSNNDHTASIFEPDINTGTKEICK